MTRRASNVDRGSGSARTNACKVNVVASPTGEIQQLDTEGSRAGDGILSMVGTTGGICGVRLKVKPQVTSPFLLKIDAKQEGQAQADRL